MDVWMGCVDGRGRIDKKRKEIYTGSKKEINHQVKF